MDKDDANKCRDLSEKGYYFRYVNMDSAMYYATRAVSLAKQLKDTRWEAFALSDLGLVYRDIGELPRSLALQISALGIAEKYDYPVIESNALRRTGLVYLDLGNYGGAINYCKRALQFVPQSDNRGKGYNYLVTSMAYLGLKNPDSASYFIQKTAERFAYLGVIKSEFYLTRGDVYWLKGNKDSALAAWREGLRSALSNKNKQKNIQTASRIFYAMGDMYRKINPDSSIFYAKRSLEFGKMASFEKEILFASNLLFILYDSLKHPNEALYYSKIVLAVKDRLLGPGNVLAIEELIARENARQTEIQAERASYQNRVRQILLAMGMGAFLIIAFTLYQINRKKQKTNLTLAKQKAEIQETLTQLKSTQAQLIQSEKMASLGELTAGIAHEIQNPLNFVNNFSDINKELIDEASLAIKAGRPNEAVELLSTLRENEDKIGHHGKRAESIVKGMLQHSRETKGQKEPTDINSLADEYLRLLYQGLRAKDKTFNAKLHTEFDQTIGKINIIPQEIGRVFLNLYGNAFYAVCEKKKLMSEDYDPTVAVSTSKMNGSVIIKVKDNGNGIPEKIKGKIFQPFFTTKPAGQGTGLGLSLSYDIIKAHGGEIKLETKEGEGSEFIIQLKVL